MNHQPYVTQSVRRWLNLLCGNRRELLVQDPMVTSRRYVYLTRSASTLRRSFRCTVSASRYTMIRVVSPRTSWTLQTASANHDDSIPYPHRSCPVLIGEDCHDLLTHWAVIFSSPLSRQPLLVAALSAIIKGSNQTGTRGRGTLFHRRKQG